MVSLAGASKNPSVHGKNRTTKKTSISTSPKIMYLDIIYLIELFRKKLAKIVRW